MAASISYSVTTGLPIGRVWGLLTDITNWPKFSDIYSDLRWEGEPWKEGSRLVVQINFPIVVSGRYTISVWAPIVLIRYVFEPGMCGFAMAKTIRLNRLVEETSIEVTAHLEGEVEMAGGGSEFLRQLTMRWLDEFARFCDSQV
jgi:hypothetical protein